MRSSQIKHSFSQHELGVVSVSAAADGHSCVTSSMDGNLRQFDLQTMSLKNKIEAGPVEIWQVSVHPLRSSICATGSHSGHVNIWSFDTLAKVDSAKPGAKFTMAVVRGCICACLPHFHGGVRVCDALILSAG